MTLDNQTVIERYPTLFHMAEVGAWPSIREHGLLSTSALLDLYEVRGSERRLIEATHRPELVTLVHPNLGTAVIRDQKPMTDAALRKCLQGGITPSDWYKLLNHHVFFWLSRQRLDRLLAARAYRNRRHTVIAVDTARLLASRGRDVYIAPINTGSTIFNPQPRGISTFSRISAYPYDEWVRRRNGWRDAIVELAVRGGVKDIEKCIVRVTEEGGSGSTRLILRT